MENKKIVNFGELLELRDTLVGILGDAPDEDTLEKNGLYHLAQVYANLQNAFEEIENVALGLDGDAILEEGAIFCFDTKGEEKVPTSCNLHLTVTKGATVNITL